MNRHMRALVGRCGDPAPIGDDVGLARLKRDVDRVLTDNRCQRSGRRLNQITLSEIGQSDTSVDRRPNFRITEIDLRLFEERLRLEDIGLRGLLISRPLVDRGLWYILIVHEFLAALQLQVGVDFSRLGFGEIGVLLVDGGFVGILLDAKQQVAFFDMLTFGESPLFDESGDAGDDIDFVDCHDAANEIPGLRDLSAGHRFHRDRGRRRSALRCGHAAGRNENKRRERERAWRHPTGADHRMTPFPQEMS
jgi:hypothetical protein